MTNTRPLVVTIAALLMMIFGLTEVAHVIIKEVLNLGDCGRP
jgi:hypothetical protein